MGLWVVDILSDQQLAAAAARYRAICAGDQHYLVEFAHLRKAWANHWNAIMRMPAGGAHWGGSLQTGFEMELTTLPAVLELMKDWPNYESSGSLHSWEARSMEEAGEGLNFGKTSDWGVANAKPIKPLPTTPEYRGVIMASPPITVTFRQRADGTTSLTVRTPLTLWTEDDAIVLPPDDKNQTPFYVDPPDRPGMHRDLFKAWAHKMLGELVALQYPMTALALQHLPAEYMSDSCAEEFDDERSVSSWGIRSYTSSDLEGYEELKRTTDSSDEELKRTTDSSDEE